MNTTNNKNISASRSIAPPPSQHAKPSQQGQGKSTACDDDDDDKDGLRSILAAAIGLTSLGAPKKANASTPTHDDGSLPDGPFESSSGPTTKIDKSQEPARKKSKLKKKTKKYKMPKTAVTKEARSTSVPSLCDRQPVTPYPHLFPDYPNPPTSSSTSPPPSKKKNAPLPPERQKINQRSWTTTPLEAAMSADGDEAEMITRKLHMLRLIYAYSIYTTIVCMICNVHMLCIYTQYIIHCIYIVYYYPYSHA